MTSTSSPFASSSVPRHLARGGGAVLAAVGAIVLSGRGDGLAIVGAVLLGGLTVFLLRGCPMCWVVGLFETASHCKRCERRPLSSLDTQQVLDVNSSLGSPQ